MKLSKETKDLIRKEYNEFKESMYAGKSLQERQELDQFFTPPEISIRLIEELSDLSGNILDPTCGSGNLLAAALIAGADPDKVYGNDYDSTMVEKCRKRLQDINPNVQYWQVHQGNDLIPDCLTEFGPDYDKTILVALLEERPESNKKGAPKFTWLDRPELYVRPEPKSNKPKKSISDVF